MGIIIMLAKSWMQQTELKYNY